MIKAYEITDASALAPFMYLQLMISTFYGWLIFNTLPDAFTILGMSVILASGLYVLNEGRKNANLAKLTKGNEVSATPE
jgi:drug/metabolite transporter (DMT)-like permease